METLADRRLHRLFELWDQDQTGKVDFKELCLGLKSLDKDTAIEDIAADAARAIIAFDADSDQMLSRKEFSDFMNM